MAHQSILEKERTESYRKGREDARHSAAANADCAYHDGLEEGRQEERPSRSKWFILGFVGGFSVCPFVLNIFG